uniref:collagen alpha-1(XXI) chain-like n=1 Tax=Oncorhynchus gorbuscha TaxID=8017 RepID=UPI001EAF7824|nr:collagen alpha-1(XXI) chain-like [Oncorhynchus gorbuscha]
MAYWQARSKEWRAIFPEGMPPSYVFVAKSPTDREKLDLIRVLSQDRLKQFVVTLNGLDKSATFTITTSSVIKKEQCVIFNDRGIKG